MKLGWSGITGEKDMDMSYESLWQAYTEAEDELATMRVELAAAQARVDELEFYIERDKDGDGFISKDAMDLLFPDTTEGES